MNWYERMSEEREKPELICDDWDCDGSALVEYTRTTPITLENCKQVVLGTRPFLFVCPACGRVYVIVKKELEVVAYPTGAWDEIVSAL